MFKILVALALLVAIQAQMPGGFTNRPDLINDAGTQVMVKLATSDLLQKQNLLITPVDVISVATQVVNGVNYRIIFTARQYASDMLLVCTTKIYKPFTGPQSVTTAHCD